MIQAIIFDMDGLMIDSEKLHFKAYQEFLARRNIIFTIKDYLGYFGRSDKDISLDLIAKHQLPILVDKCMEEKNDIFKNHFIKKIVPKKGLFNVLKKLHADKYLLAVASGSHIDEIEMIVFNLKVGHFFNSLISADFVEHGKPAPDIFLLAAEKLGVRKDKCLVLEDSPSGVIAAKKAGMQCFAIPSPEVKNLDFSQADKILESLEDVYQFLKKYS